MSETAFDVSFTLNGAEYRQVVQPETMLIDMVRNRLGLTGSKVACDQAVCGACTVLVDGQPTAACATLAFQVDGCEILTIEGLAGADGTLDPVQQAFHDTSAFQCGFCTPGMIMLAKALLDQNPQPDRATIRNWMGANICRCTGYEMIFEAVEDAAKRTAAAGAGS